MRKTIARTILACAIAVVGVWAGCLISVFIASQRDEAAALTSPAVAIIVLGAAQYDGRPSPVLRARLDHAVLLWQQGMARRLIVTGGRADGDRTTEAAVGRRYAVEHGVPDSAILLESEGRTTDQSLRAASALLREIVRQDSTRTAILSPPDADARHTAILVSDPFHMLRLGVVARRYGIVAYTSPTRTSPISNNAKLSWQYMFRESLKVPFVVLMERSAAD